MTILGILKLVGIAGLLVFIVGMFGFVKVPTDKVCYISGFRRRKVTGRIGFFLRWFERVDYLDLSVFSVDVNTTEDVPTNDYINITVDAIAKLQIDEEVLDKASKNFLNKKSNSIAEDVKDVLEGNLREIIGQLKIEEIVQDRKNFNEKVQENVAPDLKEMGLKIISFTIQNFQEDKGVIENLGQENVSKITKEALIAKANAEKEVNIAQANANKEAIDIKIKTDTEIAEKENELAIKKADLKVQADTKKAMADVTYEKEFERNRKEVEQAKGEADFQKEEINIKTQKAKLEAEVKNEQEIKADADLYKRTKEAEAKFKEKQKEMEAIELEAKIRASAKKIEAEAEAEAIRIKAEANAKAIEQEGMAQAKSKQAILNAEAEGKKNSLLAEAEGLDKKAEAMKKYGEGALLEMYFKALPEIAKNVASPLEKVDKITMYGDGNGEKMIGDITKMIEKVNSGVGDSLGIDLKSIVAGYLGKGLVDKINKKVDNEDVTDKS
jgi:flotillin family protein